MLQNLDYIENKYGMVTDVCMYGDQCMAMYDIIPYMVNQKIKKKEKKSNLPPWLTLCPFCLERYREPEHSTKKCKNSLNEIFPLF